MMDATLPTQSLRQRLDPALVLMWGLGSTAAVAVLALGAALGSSLYGIPVVLALLFAVAQAAAIPLAIMFPRAAMALSVAAVLAFAVGSTAESGSPWPIAVTSMVAQSCVILIATVRSDWRTGLIGWAVGVAGGVIVGLSALGSSSRGGAVVADLIVFASVSGAVYLGALLVSQWQAVRRQLQREQQVSASEFARREIAEERTRIARELHDVVAHGMSAIQVQASSARYRIPSLSEEAAEEFDDLAATARSAMGEMRRLLGVLRSEDTVVETAPQPGLAQVGGLIERAARSGSSVRLDDRIEPADAAAVDPSVSLTVYRLVQESLSNVARHATGADTLVILTCADESVTVEVRNDASSGRPASAPAPDTGGHGIRGMKERAALLGGTLEAGRTDDGGFAVRAALPLNRSGATV
jgi:signal transduction histidine kinase